MSKILELIKFDKTFAPDSIIIGTDEAGRGPGAGGVYAAAVHFENFDKNLIDTLSKLNDSKKLSEKTRATLSEDIKQHAVFSIQYANIEQIEKMNILQSSLDCMKRACNDVFEQLHSQKSPYILVDGNKLIPQFNHKQSFVIKGDGKSASIAAASILAKVARDEYMYELAEKFPQYGWDKNKGYLTKAHIEAIKTHGITKHHRPSFLKKIIQIDDKTINKEPIQRKLI